MTRYETLFSLSCLAALSELSGLPAYFKWWLNTRFLVTIAGKRVPVLGHLKRIKPFDCALCMGFWLGCIYGFAETERAHLTVLYGAVTSVAATVIAKYARV